MKNYWIDTQKGKVITMMIIKWNDWYEDFELEKNWDIFVWNNAWPRLSQLLKDWVVEVKYYPNPNVFKTKNWWSIWYKRAKYRLTEDCFNYYKELYSPYLIQKAYTMIIENDFKKEVYNKLKNKNNEKPNLFTKIIRWIFMN